MSKILSTDGVQLFEEGDMVVWDRDRFVGAFTLAMIRNHGEGPFKVLKVEPDHRGEVAPHPQMVTILDGKGKEERATGIWFKKT